MAHSLLHSVCEPHTACTTRIITLCPDFSAAPGPNHQAGALLVFGAVDSADSVSARETSWRVRTLPLALPADAGAGRAASAAASDAWSAQAGNPGLGGPPRIILAGCLGDCRGPSFAPLALLSVSAPSDPTAPALVSSSSSGRALACVSVLDLLELSADPRGAEVERLVALYCQAGAAFAPVARAADADGGCLVRRLSSLFSRACCYSVPSSSNPHKPLACHIDSEKHHLASHSRLIPPLRVVPRPNHFVIFKRRSESARAPPQKTSLSSSGGLTAPSAGFPSAVPAAAIAVVEAGGAGTGPPERLLRWSSRRRRSMCATTRALGCCSSFWTVRARRWSRWTPCPSPACPVSAAAAAAEADGLRLLPHPRFPGCCLCVSNGLALLSLLLRALH